MVEEPCGKPSDVAGGVLVVGPDVWDHLTAPSYPNRQYVHVHHVDLRYAGRCSLVVTNSPLAESLHTGSPSPAEVDPEFGDQTDFWEIEEGSAQAQDPNLLADRVLPWDSGPKPLPRELPLHRTEAGWPRCGTCDGSSCPDCTDRS